jgi:hypothetical protein
VGGGKSRYELQIGGEGWREERGKIQKQRAVCFIFCIYGVFFAIYLIYYEFVPNFHGRRIRV